MSSSSVCSCVIGQTLPFPPYPLSDYPFILSPPFHHSDSTGPIVVFGPYLPVVSLLFLPVISLFFTNTVPTEYISLQEMKQGQCICPLSWSVHCNTGDGKCNKRGGRACTPHPPQLGPILPSSLNVRQKAAVATLCTL